MSFYKEDLHTFDGKGNARAWASHVRRYRSFVDSGPLGIQTDYDWLKKIALHLDGDAADYLDILTKAHGAQMPFATVEDFLQQMITVFSPEGSLPNPRDALDACKQHGPVHVYIKQFNAIALQIPDLGPAEGVHAFLKGLKPTLAAEVKMHRPTSMIHAMALAADADGPVYARERAQRGAAAAAAPSYLPSSSSVAGSGFSGHSQPVAMELGTAAAAAGGNPTGCYICGREGHRWKQCRQKARFPCKRCGHVGHPAMYCRAAKGPGR